MRANHQQNEWMAFDVRLSESVSWLCGYSRDIGAIQLDMKVKSAIQRINEGTINNIYFIYCTDVWENSALVDLGSVPTIHCKKPMLPAEV